MKTLNLKQIGLAMREMVTKAIKIIQEEAHNMVVQTKAHATKEDHVTSGDYKAQEMYIGEITRLFPHFGIIAEEKNLAIPCTETGDDIYFTVDPLDGTNAYVRKQSHGVGTMIALVKNGKVIAAYIGDINTGEIYGYADEDNTQGEVIRYRFGKEAPLQPEIAKPLTRQYILLHDAPWKLDPFIQKMMRAPEEGGAFKNMEIGCGSIGTHMARLWKGEVGGIVLEPGNETPWDQTPVLGITKRLGFVFYRIDGAENRLVRYVPETDRATFRKEFAEIITHKTHEEELLTWIDKQKK